MPAVQSKPIKFVESDFDEMFFVTVDGYENYKINPDGVIKNVKTNKILKPCLKKCGYYCVDLCKNGIRKTKLIHKLVANTFLTKTDDCCVVDHINNIKSDNKIENLRFVTYKQNNRNRLKHSGITYKFVNELPLNSLHITQIKDINICDIGLYYNKNTNEFYLKMSDNKYRIMYKNSKSEYIIFSFNNKNITYSPRQLKHDYPSYFKP